MKKMIMLALMAASAVAVTVPAAQAATLNQPPAKLVSHPTIETIDERRIRCITPAQLDSPVDYPTWQYIFRDECLRIEPGEPVVGPFDSREDCNRCGSLFEPQPRA
ncbi:hypothetical protein ACPB9J_06005 [Streptomyces lavendulocolor]|uniref:hypothetical protein n=1 Tax=Streptomyces lavendulocolor TaxID=67316 RepID=UPI003C2C7D66